MPYELTETLYLDETREEVVKEGDPRARFLVGVEGQTISDEEAARLGLGGDKPQHKAVHEAPADKAMDGPKAPKARGTE